MSILDNYRVSFVKSKRSTNNPLSGSMAFHLRIKKILDEGSDPFLALDLDESTPIGVNISTNATGKTEYTVSVLLQETTLANQPPVIFKDYIFSKPNTLAYDNMDVKVNLHLNGEFTTYTKETDTSGTKTTKKIVHDEIPIEFPLDDRHDSDIK